MQRHIDAWTRVCMCGCRQIADPNEDTAEAVAAQFGIPRWTCDAAEVIRDPDVDAVVICSPTALHAQQIVDAAAHGKHIFCEKPVDLSLEGVDRAIAAVRPPWSSTRIWFCSL